LVVGLPISAAAIVSADASRPEPPSARHVKPSAKSRMGSGGNSTHPTARPGQLSVAEPFKIPGASLEPAGWDDLDGWTNDDHASAFATFQASCRLIVRNKSSNDVRPVRAALQAVCARAISAGAHDAETARQFFETNFRPVRIRKLGDAAGFLTGYYEPIVDGSRFPTQEFTVPIYRRPPGPPSAGRV